MKNDDTDYLPTRRSLLSRLKSWDDQTSWRDFFETYWKLIYGAARKSGLTHEEAEEVVQETVITVTRKIGELKYDPALGSFKGWLLNTTRWKINDQFRKRRKPGAADHGAAPHHAERETDAIERVPDPIGFDLDAVWEAQWRQNLLDAALARIKEKIDPRQFQIFDLYVLKEWSVSKITQTLHVSAAQVYLTKHRVAVLLKKEIESIESRLF